MQQSCRVALAAYLHDLGKFAERAGAFDKVHAWRPISSSIAPGIEKEDGFRIGTQRTPRWHSIS